MTLLDNAVQSSVTVIGIDQNAIRKDIDAITDPLQVLRDLTVLV